jgi:hypothetical protein
MNVLLKIESGSWNYLIICLTKESYRVEKKNVFKTLEDRGVGFSHGLRVISAYTTNIGLT